MRRLVVCVCVLGLLIGGKVRAEECDLGVYLGVKMGVGIARQSNSAFGMEAVDMGALAKWDHHRDGMGTMGDTVFGGGANIGYDFSRRFTIPVRVELDYTILANSEDKSTRVNTYNFMYNGMQITEDLNVELQTKIGLQTLMLNAWVDIPTGTKFTPYFGGGIGGAFIRHRSSAIEEPGTANSETITGKKNFSNFAWTVGAGVSYEINRKWAMDLGYRYVDAGKHKMHYAGEGDGMYTSLGKIKSHNIMLGIRRTF